MIHIKKITVIFGAKKFYAGIHESIKIQFTLLLVWLYFLILWKTHTQRKSWQLCHDFIAISSRKQKKITGRQKFSGNFQLPVGFLTELSCGNLSVDIGNLCSFSFPPIFLPIPCFLFLSVPSLHLLFLLCRQVRGCCHMGKGWKSVRGEGDHMQTKKGWSRMHHFFIDFLLQASHK